MTAKPNNVKKAAKRAQDKSKGVKNYTLPLMPASQQELQDLLVRYHFEDWREMLTLMIKAIHSGSWPDVLEVPRHEFKPSEKMLRRLEREGKIQAVREGQEDGCEDV